MNLDGLMGSVMRMAMTPGMLKGIVQGMFKNMTIETLREMAARKRSFQDLPDTWQAALRHMGESPQLREKITFPIVAGWVMEANPALYQQAMSDQVVAPWLRWVVEEGQRAVLKTP